MDIGSLLGGAKSYIFGPGTDAPTYESLRKKREIIDLLSQQAIGGEYRNWGDGVGGIMKALGARIMDNKLAPKEDEHRKTIADAIAGITGGGGGGAIGGADTGFTGLGGYSGNPATLSSSGPAPSGGAGSLIRQELIERGLPEHVADGFVMNFQDESGMNPGINEANPTVPGSRGGFGLAQWTGPRRQALEQYALGQGKPVSDTDTQLDFLMSELQGPEKGAAEKIMATSDPGQAGAAVAQFFLRPAQEHLDRRVAEYTGGGGFDPAMLGMGGGEPDMGRVGQLAELMSDPYVEPGQQMVIKALIEREMDQGGGIDPYQAARLGLDSQRLQLERDKFAAGTREGVQSYGTAQWAMRDDPATEELDPSLAPYVIDKAGNVKWLDLGGAKALPPTDNVNLGTSIQPLAPGATPVGEPLAVDNSGKAAATAEGTAVGEAVGGAQAKLPIANQTLDEALTHIDAIANDPALAGITGKWQGKFPDFMLSQEGVNLRARIDQFKGTTFLAARDILKGGGQITDYEGRKAEEAMARLDRAQDEKSYKAALAEVKKHLQRGFEIMKQQASGNVTGGAGGSGGMTGDWMVDTDPSTWTEEQMQEAERRWGLRK